jgi:hypothetical protein
VLGDLPGQEGTFRLVNAAVDAARPTCAALALADVLAA